MADWIKCSESMPNSGRTILAYYKNSHGMGRTIRAQWIKAWTMDAGDFADPDTECVEYSEQDDCFYLIEGWYECNDNWEDYSLIAVNEGIPTYWQPLPTPPEQE